MAAQNNNTQAIQTNISVTKKEAEYYKKLTALDPTALPLPQGDGAIRISPFDDYIIFTLYDDTGEDGEMESTPIDLSNVGTLTLVFIGETDEIRIPNWTRVQEVDLAQGQVLFKIDKESSKKILALDNKNFYISTRMEDPSGESDESVLYTGTFLGIADAAQQSLTSKLNDQGLVYSKELAKLNEQIVKLNSQISEMLSLDEEQIAIIQALEASNLTLTNEVATLSEQLGSAQSELALKEAEEAQRVADLQKKKRQQVNALKKKIMVEQSKAKQKSYYKQAATNLQNFNTSSNQVTTGNTQNARSFFDLIRRRR